MKIEHILAGFIPETRGRDGLALAVLLARQAGARLTVAHVHPPAWPTPGPGKVDAEWRAYITAQAAQALQQARLALDDVRDVPIDYVLEADRGSGRGLVRLAGRLGADAVVIGSAPRGARSRIALGSTADQLLHASPVPVALAPREYAEDHPPAIRRLAVAYRRGPASDDPVRPATEIAAALGTPLHLITLVMSRGMRVKAAEQTLDRLRERAAADLREAARGCDVEVTTQVLEGGDVAAALGGAECEGALLVCASSTTGPLRRVFLGDTSMKIIRASGCPVMMLPRTPPPKPAEAAGSVRSALPSGTATHGAVSPMRDNCGL
ncbi:universal stress protein [Streptosporangium sandarakinum]